MVTQIILIINIIIIYEILNFFNFYKLIENNISFYKKIFKLFKFKRVSDNWRERLLLNYSKNLLLASLKIILVLIICLLIIFVSNFFKKDYYIFLLSITGFFEIIFLAAGYSLIKKIFK